MDLGYSEEQEMLRKVAREFLEKECPSSVVRQLRASAEGYSPDMWRKMADLGWQGLIIPEQYGGTGGTIVDLCVLYEELGRFLCPTPHFTTAVMAAYLLMDVGNDAQKQEYLTKIANGDIIMTVAQTEPDTGWGPEYIQVPATQQGGDWVINGTKLFTLNANVADSIIVAARTGQGENGISLFVVDAKAPGVSITPLATMAGDKQCEVILSNVRVPAANVLGQVGQGWPALQRMLRKSEVVLCAEMSGGARWVLETSVQYAKDRVQFGRPIGSFQAVQHLCAEMVKEVDGAWLITYEAAWKVEQGLPSDADVAMAKAFVGKTFRETAFHGHEIHGGIGFMVLHDMHLYSLRAKTLELYFGDYDFHRDRLADALGF